MLYNANDMYIGRSLDLYGEFSEGEADFFHNYLKPGMLVVDVGANIGCHTVLMAKAVGPEGAVVAFEPQRIVHQMLCANAALNGLLNVHALNAAAGREEGGVQVPPMDYAAAGNFGGVRVAPGEGAGEPGGERVRLTTIDGLGLHACHFIKIDVQGMELDVIEGAAETIGVHRPALYFENEDKARSPALLARLLGLDYRLYWHAPPLYNPDNFLGNTDNIFGNTVSLNVIGLPRALEQTLSGLAEISDAGDWPGTVVGAEKPG